jgi:predicted nucleic acid-binding protein
MSRFAIDPASLLEVARGQDGVNPAHRLVAPNVLRSHALNLLLDQVRGGQLSEDEALALHERITQLKIRLLGDRVSRRTAWQIARENGGTILDAEYIAVAKLQADALVTTDSALVSMAADVVPIASLTDLLSD